MLQLQRVGHKILEWAQSAGLVIVALSTLYAIGQHILDMISNRGVALADLLMLFIYLEVLAMVAMYLEMGKLPIRIPLYIAIVALARYLILDMKEMDTLRMLGVAGTAVLLAGCVYIIRYGHYRFPYAKED